MWRLVSVNGAIEIESLGSFSGRFLTVQFKDFPGRKDWSVLPYRQDWRDVYMELSRQTTWVPTDTGLLFGDWHQEPCPFEDLPSLSTMS
jgi:hypothetical protein